MSPLKTVSLYQRYPKIFAERGLGPEKSAMAFGLDCGDGWFDIIDRLCAQLQESVDTQKEPQVVATQVKEKFGFLQFYVHSATDAQRAMIRAAESESGHTCEECGRAGQLVVDQGWRMVRCQDHGPSTALPLRDHFMKRVQKIQA